MPLIVLSYVQEWEHLCGRGCNCLLDSGPSSFDLREFENTDDAAGYLATRIDSAGRAECLHCVFECWEDVRVAATVGPSLCSSHFAIQCPGSIEDGTADPLRRGWLEQELRDKVQAKLAQMEQDRLAYDAKRKEAAKVEVDQRQRERDEAELARLKAKLEG